MPDKEQSHAGHPLACLDPHPYPLTKRYHVQKEVGRISRVRADAYSNVVAGFRDPLVVRELWGGCLLGIAFLTVS